MSSWPSATSTPLNSSISRRRRCASGTPRVWMPTSATRSRSGFPSMISCAIRAAPALDRLGVEDSDREQVSAQRRRPRPAARAPPASQPFGGTRTRPRSSASTDEAARESARTRPGFDARWCSRDRSGREPLDAVVSASGPRARAALARPPPRRSGRRSRCACRGSARARTRACQRAGSRDARRPHLHPGELGERLRRRSRKRSRSTASIDGKSPRSARTASK